MSLDLNSLVSSRWIFKHACVSQSRSLLLISLYYFIDINVSYLAVVPGSSINSLFSQIQDIVDQQQKKTLWIPVSSN